jgi:hypothetical protein
MNVLAEVLTASITTVSLSAAALWLFRQWIVARLTADIRLENDSKLEEVRAQLNRTREALGNLSSAGHTAFSQAQVALLPHRITAINTVWSSVLEWNQMATASMFVALLPLDWVKAHGSDPSTTSTFKTLLGPNHLDFLKKRGETELVRPLLSECAWALYAAYSGFYFSRISRAAMLTLPSIDHADIWPRMDERSLIEASATPEILKLYDTNMIQGTTTFLEYLKSQMLHEFRAELSGTRDSEGAVSNASAILAAANALVQSSEQKPKTPNLAT